MVEKLINGKPQEMEAIIREARVIAVLGITERAGSESVEVAQYLKDNGYSVYGVNPRYQSVLGGIPVVGSLAEVPEQIDIVDVWRSSRHLPSIVEDAVAVGAKTVWAQIGIDSEEAIQKADKMGINIVVDTCLRVQHRWVTGQI